MLFYLIGVAVYVVLITADIVRDSKQNISTLRKSSDAEILTLATLVVVLGLFSWLSVTVLFVNELFMIIKRRSKKDTK